MCGCGRFVKNHTDEELNEIFDRIILVKSGDAPSKEQIKECFRFYRPGVSMNTPEEWYSLLRAAQGDLEAHARGLRYMIDNADFLRDSLFCEWGYVINLDKGVLEVYRGFQKAPSKNRYYNPFGKDDYYNCPHPRGACNHPRDTNPWQPSKTRSSRKG